MVVYVVTTGDQILIDGDLFQDEHNITAVCREREQAKEHLRQFVNDFFDGFSNPLKWSNGTYLPCSDPDKGFGVEFKFTLSGSEIKVKRKIYCQYEEVEVSEV